MLSTTQQTQDEVERTKQQLSFEIDRVKQESNMKVGVKACCFTAEPWCGSMLWYFGVAVAGGAKVRNWEAEKRVAGEDGWSDKNQGKPAEQREGELGPCQSRKASFNIYSYFSSSLLCSDSWGICLPLSARCHSKWTAQRRLCRQRRRVWCDLWVRRKRSCSRCGKLRKCSSRYFSRSDKKTPGSLESCRASWKTRSAVGPSLVLRTAVSSNTEILSSKYKTTVHLSHDSLVLIHMLVYVGKSGGTAETEASGRAVCAAAGNHHGSWEHHPRRCCQTGWSPAYTLHQLSRSELKSPQKWLNHHQGKIWVTHMS